MSGVSELLELQGLRSDGRRWDELRHLAVEVGVVADADGSASVRMGNTVVLAAVHGPHEGRGAHRQPLESKAASLVCEVRRAPFSGLDGLPRRMLGRGRTSRKELELASRISATLSSSTRLELFPRSQIDLRIDVMQEDGGVFAAAVNAASLALVDAAVPMRDYVTACTAGRVASGRAVVDVGGAETAAGAAAGLPEVSVAMLAATGEIAALEMARQRVHLDHLEAVIEAAAKGCVAIRERIDDHVRQHVATLDVDVDDAGTR